MATAISTDPPQTSPSQYISFGFTEGLRGMLPTTQLTETINLELGQIVQMPDLPPTVVGVCGWRGDVLWLVDLSTVLALPPLLSTDYQSSKCSVLRVTVNRQTFGLLVSEVGQLVRCDRQQIKPGLPPMLKPDIAPMIEGLFQDPQGRQFISIDLNAILETLQTQ